MPLLTLLQDFAAQIAVATTDAPDEYPNWSDGYQAHKRDLENLWAQIRPHLKRDTAQAERLGSLLQEMIEAFDAGEKERGRKLAWMMYNADLKNLR